MINKILEKFDEQFGKDGIDKNSDSIGRSAGCDDCSVNIKLRAEHKDFLRQSLVEVLEELKGKVERMKKEGEDFQCSTVDSFGVSTPTEIVKRLSSTDEVYNQTLSDILSTITSEIESNK